MPNTLGHWGNTNSNHSEFSSDSMAAVKNNSKYWCLIFLRGTLFQIITLRLYLESQEGRANSCKCIDFLMCTGKKGTS